MNALAISPVYAKLLAKIPPKVIRSEAENEHYTVPSTHLSKSDR